MRTDIELPRRKSFRERELERKNVPGARPPRMMRWFALLSVGVALLFFLAGTLLYHPGCIWGAFLTLLVVIVTEGRTPFGADGSDHRRKAMDR